jgi:hypothetical protein
MMIVNDSLNAVSKAHVRAFSLVIVVVMRSSWMAACIIIIIIMDGCMQCDVVCVVCVPCLKKHPMA